MKKLILKNHLNEKLLELDLFVEGQDFSHTLPEPKAFWLGTIMVVDAEPEPVMSYEEGVQKALETTDIQDKLSKLELELELELGTSLDEAAKAALDETITMKQAKDAAEAEDAAEEITNEPEEIHNQSNGDTRPSEAIEPESVKKLPEKPKARKSTKGGKNPRKHKATQGIMGGRTG